jgi:aryl-alcohol dehydrogenase-like predicted oxidoreductase
MWLIFIPAGNCAHDRPRTARWELLGFGCICGVMIGGGNSHRFAKERDILSEQYNQPMQNRSLGSSGLQVTPVGLGLAALGRPGYINLGHAEDLQGNTSIAAMETHAHTILDEAWRAGIRYFDVARSYGRAEEFLSSWLKARKIEPEDVTIGSKWGYIYSADWRVELPKGQQHEVKEHSLRILQRQIAETLSYMDRYLDLYQIHSATLESKVLENQAVLAELARMRDEGLAIGFTVSGEKQSETIWRALEIDFDGRPLFTSVQATWNLLEQSATEALQAARQAGLGVIIKEALANGRLTPRNRSSGFKEEMALLTDLAQRRHTTVDALALAACLHQPFTTLVLSGAAQSDHLNSNLKALQVDWNNELLDMLEPLREPADVYWTKRSHLKWN